LNYSNLNTLTHSLIHSYKHSFIHNHKARGGEEAAGTTNTKADETNGFRDACRSAKTSLTQTFQHLQTIQRQSGAPAQRTIVELDSQVSECTRAVEQLEGCWERLRDERDKVGAAYRQLRESTTPLTAALSEVRECLLHPVWETAHSEFYRRHLEKEIANVIEHSTNATREITALTADLAAERSDGVGQCQTQLETVRHSVEAAGMGKVVVEDRFTLIKEGMQSVEDSWRQQTQILESINTDVQQHNLTNTLDEQFKSALSLANDMVADVGREHVWQSEPAAARRAVEAAHVALDCALELTTTAVARKLELDRQRQAATAQLQSIEVDMSTLRDQVFELDMDTFEPVQTLIHDFERYVKVIRPQFLSADPLTTQQEATSAATSNPMNGNDQIDDDGNECSPERAVELCSNIVQSLRAFISEQISLRAKASVAKDAALAELAPVVCTFEAAVNAARVAKLELNHADIWKLVQDTEARVQTLMTMAEPDHTQPISTADLAMRAQLVRHGISAVESAGQQVAQRVAQVARNELAYQQLKVKLDAVSVSLGVVVGRQQSSSEAKGSLYCVAEQSRSVRNEAERSFKEALKVMQHVCCGGGRVTDDALSRAKSAVAAADHVTTNSIEELRTLQGWEDHWKAALEACQQSVVESTNTMQTLRCLLDAGHSSSNSTSTSASHIAAKEAMQLVETTKKQVSALNRFCQRDDEKCREPGMRWMGGGGASAESSAYRSESDDDDDDDDDVSINALWARLRPRSLELGLGLDGLGLGLGLETGSSSGTESTKSSREQWSRDAAETALLSAQQSCQSLSAAIETAHVALTIDQSAHRERVRATREQDARGSEHRACVVQTEQEQHRASVKMRTAVANRVEPFRKEAKELRGFADAALIEAGGHHVAPLR
jgi:hypothetical protein